ncbi:unnamed protein product [Ceratitis capitata]|uniref:(Mediterranean fruit fly) hypothetical protein n=1 Tax=Ceratitis capitata TaxID=7213 RepID=A0A811UXY9_CERCA|nr:unnamed protein product [Ceratitis capitata]
MMVMALLSFSFFFLFIFCLCWCVGGDGGRSLEELLCPQQQQQQLNLVAFVVVVVRNSRTEVDWGFRSFYAAFYVLLWQNFLFFYFSSTFFLLLLLHKLHCVCSDYIAQVIAIDHRTPKNVCIEISGEKKTTNAKSSIKRSANRKSGKKCACEK